MLSGKRVLLCEDDEDSAFLLGLSFERAGAVVSSARSIGEALQLADNPVDLLVSDVHLPDGDGADLLVRWPSSSRPASIALTGDVEHETKKRLVAAGFLVVLEKPVMPEDLLEQAGRLLDK